jgi:SAM-dependent methyltransferase
VTPLDPRAVEADLVAYYDGEEGRANNPLDSQRVAAREAFLVTLPASSRVLELGSGPGRDAAGFVGSGHRYVALDLSFEHCRRCRIGTGAPAVRASVRQLPVRDGALDAVWTMSTLMHVPEGATEGVLAEIHRVLAPGGVLAVGVWGGIDDERTNDKDMETGRPPRLFNHRTDERWRPMLEAVGTVETYDVWRYDWGDLTYQWALVRR